MNEPNYEKNLLERFEESFRAAFARPAFRDYTSGEEATYGLTGYRIMQLHEQFRANGIEEGDKIALAGADSLRWCTAFMAIITYGAVAVPLMPNFPAEDMVHLVSHSEAKALFADKVRRGMLSNYPLEGVRLRFNLEDLSLREGDSEVWRAANELPTDFTPEDIRFSRRSNDELMLINYTSGTSGMSKGVMLTGANLSGNVVYAVEDRKMFRSGDRLLCFLPLAHTYSCSFNLLAPMACNELVVILGQMPTPRVLAKAFQEVKPHIILTVPLIIEKIYKLALQPKLAKRYMRVLMAIPIVKNVVYANIRKRLSAFFGGEFREVIAGGAALAPEIDTFFHRIGFPLTVGYGMTECGPLICYSPCRIRKPHSCGRPLPKMQVRIVAERKNEIEVRGLNVCQGYYKQPEATKELFREDGWMRTGDLGYLDKQNNLFIVGRSKNMILSASGENIYPEEIESKVASLPYIEDCLVVQRKSGLVALIVLNEAAYQADGLNQEQARQRLSDERVALNHRLPAYAPISAFVFRDEPFEKTPKQSIKRYLYE